MAERRPLRSLLRDPVDERAIPDMWREITARRARRTGVWLRGGGLGLLAACAAAVALVGVGAFQADQAAPTAPPVAAPSPQPVPPLRLDGGEQVPVFDVPKDATAQVATLSDASRIELSPGTRLEPLASGPDVFVTSLRRGRATFDVVPGGPRRWVVEVAGTSVEVLGTRFTVALAAGGVEVSVERGRVRVFGEHVPGRSQDLLPGATLRVDPKTSAVEPSGDAPADTSEAAAVQLPAVEDPVGADSVPQRHAPGWQRAARHGQFGQAYARLGRGGVRRAAGLARGVDELLQLADVARLSGHPAEAVEPLRLIVDHHGDDHRAGLAAMTLARVELGQLGRPARAARAFERAVALGLPDALREDAHAGMVRAWLGAGDRARAEAAAAAYAKRFPDGRRSADITAWLAR